MINNNSETRDSMKEHGVARIYCCLFWFNSPHFALCRDNRSKDYKTYHKTNTSKDGDKVRFDLDVFIACSWVSDWPAERSRDL